VSSDFFKDDGGRPRLSWVFSMLFVSLLADPCCRSVRVVGEVLTVADNRNVCCTVGEGWISSLASRQPCICAFAGISFLAFFFGILSSFFSGLIDL
jgi:hypothetical protein